MKLKSLARALIFVGTDHQVPAARPNEAMLVGTGTRLVPTIYEDLRLRRRQRLLFAALSIALPTLVASLYYGLVASDRYVSETQMVLSDQASGAGSVGGGGGKSSLMSLIGMATGGEQSNEEAIVTNYLTSTQAMEAADQAIGLRRMWSASTIDFFSRLSSDASQEDFHKYYKQHVKLVSDPSEPVMKVEVEAFQPRDAQLISQTLVKLSQQKLNSAFVGMREDALQFARAEVKQSQTQLASIDEKLRNFRNSHTDIDPKASAQGVGAVTMALFGQLANTEAELRTTLSYAREDSPAVRQLRSRIAALKKQISENRGILAGDQPKEKPYADLLASYESLMLDQKFAQEAYTSAMAFLSSSRASLAHQHAYLVDFLAPTLPEQATEPRGARNVLVVFLASALLWLTGSLLASALREHAKR